MPGVDYRQIRANISIQQVIDLWPLRDLHVEGDELRGPCPIHGSEPGSRVFAINASKNLFHCFKCGAQGNQLDLWAALTKLKLHQAALDLCSRAGVTPPRIARW